MTVMEMEFVMNLKYLDAHHQLHVIIIPKLPMMTVLVNTPLVMDVWIVLHVTMTHLIYSKMLLVNML